MSSSPTRDMPPQEAMAVDAPGDLDQQKSSMPDSRSPPRDVVDQGGRNDSGPDQSHDALTPTQPSAHGAKPGYREKQVKANKVYIGGLPETTRQEDLQACFGKIGRIVNIELKLGYGFVEFDSRAAAEESVAEYHEGYFMGNKIRVELSHGGGRTAKYAGEPGACFKCGHHGHWARECPNQPSNGSSDGRKRSDADDRRSDSGRSAAPPITPMKDDYRDAYRGDAPRGGASSDRRYNDYPPPASRDAPRDYRYAARPGSPVRDYAPGPVRSRDYYDDKRDYRGPPPPAPRYDGPGAAPRPYYAPDYDPRGPYGGPSPPIPARDPYDRSYDRRGPPPAPVPYVASGRARSPPPLSAPRGRDDYDRPRDYVPPVRADYRGRSPPYSGSAPRSGDYPPASYRRRSMSPPPRGGPPPASGAYRAPYAGSDPSYRDIPPPAGPGYDYNGGRYAAPPPAVGPPLGRTPSASLGRRPDDRGRSGPGGR